MCPKKLSKFFFSNFQLWIWVTNNDGPIQKKMLIQIWIGYKCMIHTVRFYFDPHQWYRLFQFQYYCQHTTFFSDIRCYVSKFISHKKYLSHSPSIIAILSIINLYCVFCRCSSRYAICRKSEYSLHMCSLPVQGCTHCHPLLSSPQTIWHISPRGTPYIGISAAGKIFMTNSRCLFITVCAICLCFDFGSYS